MMMMMMTMMMMLEAMMLMMMMMTTMMMMQKYNVNKMAIQGQKSILEGYHAACFFRTRFNRDVKDSRR